MQQANKLMSLVQSFFQGYLVIERGLSQNTIMAYRDTLKLFFSCESASQKKRIAKLTLDDLNAKSVLRFLAQVETNRNNSIMTRNLRLAALRTFCQYLIAMDTMRIGEYQKIIAIPVKRSTRKMIEYLEMNEVKSILENINRNETRGQRDYVLLSLLYNSGARVQEICDLKVRSITFGKIPFITVIGKGNKTRQIPIWSETARLLKDYLHVNQLTRQLDANIFMNLRGQVLCRFGVRYIIKQRCIEAANICPSLKDKKISPHTFRHTIAMHLLQAGVDLSIIKNWLGHVSLATTNSYIEIDMEMKQKALASCSAMDKSPSLKKLIDRNKDVIAWLDSI